MNATTETKKTDEMSLTGSAVALLRHYLGGRRGAILLTVIALGAGLALNWSWLVAAGIAPLLVALAPCAAMCAFALCGRKMGGKACASQPSPGEEGTGATSGTTVTNAQEHASAPLSRRDTGSTT